MGIFVLAWVLLGCAVWVVAAGVTALVVGRMIKLRDQHTPTAPGDGSADVRRLGDPRPKDRPGALHQRQADDPSHRSS